MSKFSEKSLANLATCHIDLQTLFMEVVKNFDCIVTEGFRDEEAQNEAFRNRKTQLRWPNGNHNKNPSHAVDVYPCPVDMNDRERFYYFAGFVKGVAQKLKDEGKMTHSIRWGGDWNNDTQVKDNKFMDLPHYEILP